MIILAEDVRVEISGKATLVGFLGVSPWVTIGVPFPTLPLPQLSFLCLSGDPVEIGEYSIELRIFDPSGEPFLSPLTHTLSAEKSAPLAAIFQLGGLPLKGVGKYDLRFAVNGKPDTMGAFTIVQGPMPALR